VAHSNVGEDAPVGVKSIADAWNSDGPQPMQMLLDVGAAENAPAQSEVVT
jgi:hypothetical protein